MVTFFRNQSIDVTLKTAAVAATAAAAVAATAAAATITTTAATVSAAKTTTGGCHWETSCSQGGRMAPGQICLRRNRLGHG